MLDESGELLQTAFNPAKGISVAAVNEIVWSQESRGQPHTQVSLVYEPW